MLSAVQLPHTASLPPEEIEQLLNTSIVQGITEQKAFERLHQFGLNVTGGKKRASMGFKPLPSHIMLYICAVVVVYLICAEITKRLLYGYHSN